MLSLRWTQILHAYAIQGSGAQLLSKQLIAELLEVTSKEQVHGGTRSAHIVLASAVSLDLCSVRRAGEVEAGAEDVV